MKKLIAFLTVVVCFSATTVMAQPPGGGQQMTPEQRAAMIKERVKAIGGLSDVQVDTAVAVFTDRSYMANMGSMRDMAPEERQIKMKEINDLREKRLLKAGFAADLAKKVVETMSQRPGGGRGGGGGK